MQKSTLIVLLTILLLWGNAFAKGNVSNTTQPHPSKLFTITSKDKSLTLTLSCNKSVFIQKLSMLNGSNLLSPAGVFTGIQLPSGQWFTSKNSTNATVKSLKNGILITGIRYGNTSTSISESWLFTTNGKKIKWQITRKYGQATALNDMGLPQWNFAGMDTWKGGILDNGGMVWCKYLEKPNDTYGVHTGGITLWNESSGQSLRITPRVGAQQNIAAKYSQSPQGEFIVNQMLNRRPMQQRYNLSRFVRGKYDVFAPFEVPAGQVTLMYDLEYVDYNRAYSRGYLPGIDSIAVRELLNTTARYGVVDNNIVGGNGWLTNWKCLHEPFFAQIGLAVNDEAYTRNLSATLDQEQREAIKPDGRVLSRWHNEPGDEIPGTYNSKTGYYEAMWGYTIDSQTGYIINVCDQFNQTGNKSWLISHRESCEKALDWLIARDSNHNGVFEMMNNNIAEKKASDWLDIVWASFENAFVNAQMYQALNSWATCEEVLGNLPKARYYSNIAARLKETFNKPVEQGGFWSAQKKQYVYWRDNDGSIHGNNMVTPVNFAAIAFGICDDEKRIATILDEIEQRMQKEQLFHWPLCFDSFKQEEVSPGNWPFPKYENGDIFPTWGYMGIRAYAKYNKTTALKYIRLLLNQYKTDGLSSQRYSRADQKGVGEDVLSGICTTITALYSDIYGIQPKWNRMGLEPHFDASLDGTRFTYKLRGINYHISLYHNQFSIKTGNYSVASSGSLGLAVNHDTLTYYHNNRDARTIKIKTVAGQALTLEMTHWLPKDLQFTLHTKGGVKININGLLPNTTYTINNARVVKTNRTGQAYISVLASQQKQIRLSAKP